MSDHATGLDADMLASLKDLLGDKFTVLITTYLDDTESRISRLREGVLSNDHTVIRQEAHGMKGSSRNIGANGFAEICGQLEDKGRNEDAGAEQLFTAVEQTFAVLRTELDAYL